MFCSGDWFRPWASHKFLKKKLKNIKKNYIRFLDIPRVDRNLESLSDGGSTS